MSVLTCVLWNLPLGFGILLSIGEARAQDLEPRAYSASPVGTSFVGLAFARSTGDISFDPTIPITNVKAAINAPVVGLGRTFGVLGRQALLTGALPYAWGNVSGDVGNTAGSVYRSGLADVKARFSINLRGNPAMTPKEFAQRPHRNFIIGTSVSMTAPSGQYGGDKLINLGTNRWSFKPELGVSYPVKKLDLDLYAGAWFFTNNGDFYPGQLTRSQALLTTVQAHVSYTVRRSLWVAVDSTWYGGGASTVNGGAPSERQSNSRLGATVSLPLAKGQSFKIAYSSGVSGRIGSKFNTISGGWQYVWFDRH
jgi:Putative MetA-pathway of phenol degradation